MKKLNVLVLLLLCVMHINVYGKDYDASQLPIVVRSVSEWSNQYPTVINNWKGMWVLSTEGELPPVLSVVVTLNGKDTKGMTEKTFNELLMSSGTCRMEYLVKKNGVNEKKECRMRYHKSIYWAEGIEMNDPVPFPENISIKNIKNASAFDFNTFAYKTGELSEVDEASILGAAGKAFERLGFRQVDDIEHADMVFELAKGKDEYNGHKIILNVLDAKRSKSGVERIIWSVDVADIGGNLKQSERMVKTALNNICTNFPFDIPTYSQSIYTLGIAFESQQAVSTGKTLEILENSDAYDKGVRSGDAIVGAYIGYNSVFSYTQTRRYYFKPNRRNGQKNWGVDLILIFPIVPKFTYNRSETYLTYNTYRGDSKNHFRIRSKYGQVFTIYAPFEKKTFNLKYIR